MDTAEEQISELEDQIEEVSQKVDGKDKEIENLQEELESTEDGSTSVNIQMRGSQEKLKICRKNIFDE